MARYTNLKSRGAKTAAVPKKLKDLAQKLHSPVAVQKYLRSLPYNSEATGETLRSAYAALTKGTAHCLEAALLAAAILENHGYPPLVLSFESQDGLDHVLYVFKEGKKWGAIGRSRDEGLHGRSPRYRSIRDLAWSYFDPYVDKAGRITAYQLANLDDSQTNWRMSAKNVWQLERYLLDLKHRPLKSAESRYQRLLKRYLKRGPLPLRKTWW